MKRDERKITDIVKINEILDNSSYMSLALSNGEEPYIVNMNFAYEEKNGKYIFYFHGAKEGKKIDFIKKNNNAFLSFVSKNELKKSELACAWSTYYRSVTASGKVFELTNLAEVNRALTLFMKQHGYESNIVFDDKVLNRTSVYKIEVTYIEGKINEPK